MHRSHTAAIDERPHTQHEVEIGVGVHGTLQVSISANYSSECSVPVSRRSRTAICLCYRIEVHPTTIAEGSTRKAAWSRFCGKKCETARSGRERCSVRF